MTRAKTSCPDKSVLDYSSPIQYIKDILDSTYTLGPWLGGYELEGHTLLTRRYLNLKNEREKKLIAQAIVELLDDPDYSCDAIPVAAELGLEEAKEWFLNLSKRPIEEIRNIKTNDYSNGLICLVKFSSKHKDLYQFVKDLVQDPNAKASEKFVALYELGDNEPDFVLKDLEKHYEDVLTGDKVEQDQLTSISFITSGIFKKYGDSYCLELAKRFEKSLSKEIKLLYYKTLAQYQTRFKPYLEDLKKILEITD